MHIRLFLGVVVFNNSGTEAGQPVLFPPVNAGDHAHLSVSFRPTKRHQRLILRGKSRSHMQTVRTRCHTCSSLTMSVSDGTDGTSIRSPLICHRGPLKLNLDDVI